MDSQIDGELRAAALDGSVRHRADEIRHPDSDILLFVLPSHKQCVGGAAFFGKLKTRGVDVWKRHSKNMVIVVTCPSVAYTVQTRIDPTEDRDNIKYDMLSFRSLFWILEHGKPWKPSASKTK